MQERQKFNLSDEENLRLHFLLLIQAFIQKTLV